MQNLIEKISKRTGMDKEKAIEALLTVSEHVKYRISHCFIPLLT